MSNIGPTGGTQFFRDIVKRLTRLENQAGAIGSRAARIASAQITANQQVFVGPTNPSPGLAPGTEYYWIKTDGAGNLVDQIVGMA